MTLTNHQKGILLAFIGVMLLTPDSLLIRLITVDTWSLLFYRRCAHVNCLFLHGLDRHLSHPIFIRFSLCLHINSKSFRFDIKINLL